MSSFGLVAGRCWALLLTLAVVDASGIPAVADASGDGNGTKADLVSEAGRPHLVPLQREAVPIVRGGRTVGYKSAYHGRISVGGPKAQEFTVIFDTGSGHVVVPSVECESEACSMRHKYNFSASKHAVAMTAEGEPVEPGELSDQVTIGYGTGTIVGDLTRDVVCAGHGPGRPCAMVTVVTAVEMSKEPFSSFGFDGLFGLGLAPLALGPSFSFFGQVASRGAGAALPRFGLYLDRRGDSGHSEIALGGFNVQRVDGPLNWVPVVQPQLGYWMVEVRSVRVGGVELPACAAGHCRAILDTGTSHVGVPSKHMKKMREMLASRPAAAPAPVSTGAAAAAGPAALSSAALGCRPAEGSAGAAGEAAAWPELVLELAGFDVVLRPEDYMRGPEPQAAPPAESRLAGELPVCRPRLTPVALPPPLGPEIFILGEPVLQRYYTVYDWAAPRVAFGESRRPRPAADVASEAAESDEDALADLEEAEMPTLVLLQVTLTLTSKAL